MQSILALLLPTMLVASMGVYFFSYYKSLPFIAEPQIVSTDTIGSSVEGRSIDSHTFGNGETHIAIVGGIHGGYEWNTSVLAYELIEYFKKSAHLVPKSHSLTIIPVANPDGLHAIAGTTTNLTSVVFPAVAEERAHGRFNANNVDLNRNFDCKWHPESSWGVQKVSAGSSPFSEPESQALRSFVEMEDPDAFVFLHSKANAVYGSECHDGVLEATQSLLSTYASSSGYTAIEVFDTYPITGDAEGWLASIGIPALTVELNNHDDTEFEKNLRGITALFSTQFNTTSTRNMNPLPKTEEVPFYSY